MVAVATTPVATTPVHRAPREGGDETAESGVMIMPADDFDSPHMPECGMPQAPRRNGNLRQAIALDARLSRHPIPSMYFPG